LVTAVRRDSPFFWHPPDQHHYGGDLQLIARQNSRKCPGATEAFAAAYNHPELCAIAEEQNTAPPVSSQKTSTFALSHGIDGSAPEIDPAILPSWPSDLRILSSNQL